MKTYKCFDCGKVIKVSSLDKVKIHNIDAVLCDECFKKRTRHKGGK